MKTIIDLPDAGDYVLEVKGESYYQEHLRDVVIYTGESIDAKDILAELVLEDDNPHDANAVRVEIEGGQVGHLAAPSAKRYRLLLQRMNAPTGGVGQCFARIRGGFTTREGEEAALGVRLNVDLDGYEQPQARAPLTVTIPAVTIRPAIVSTGSPAATWYKVKFGGKWPLIPIDGSGAFYWLIICPLVLILDAYIILFVGIWYVLKWLVDITIAAIRHAST